MQERAKIVVGSVLLGVLLAAVVVGPLLKALRRPPDLTVAHRNDDAARWFLETYARRTREAGDTPRAEDLRDAVPGFTLECRVYPSTWLIVANPVELGVTGTHAFAIDAQGGLVSRHGQPIRLGDDGALPADAAPVGSRP